MTTQQVVDALEAWSKFVVPAFSSYDHTPEATDTALPIVIAEIQQDAVSSGGRGEGGKLQQVTQLPNARLWQVQLLILVSPDPPATASSALYGYVDLLGQSLRTDSTLGYRVPVALPGYKADYTPAEVEIGDGLIARAVRFELTVAEQVA